MELSRNFHDSPQSWKNFVEKIYIMNGRVSYQEYIQNIQNILNEELKKYNANYELANGKYVLFNDDKDYIYFELKYG